MAYSAPELLLVGAAQNLVLATSGAENVQFGPCFDLEREENGVYDAVGLW